MRLTAVDIEGRKFKRSLRGYSIREIEEFRREVIDNFEELLIENARMKEQLEKLEGEVKHFRSIEQNMNASLILAQRAADNVRASANQEAEMIARDARAEAQTMLREARRERAAIDKSTAELLQQRDEFVEEFHCFLKAHLRRLEPQAAPPESALQFGPAPTQAEEDAETPTDTDGAQAHDEDDTTPDNAPGWLVAVGDD